MSSVQTNRFLKPGDPGLRARETEPVYTAAKFMARQPRHTTVGPDEYRSVEAPWWLVLVVAATGIYTAMLAVLRALG